MLGMEDHGLFSFWLHLKFDDTGQGFGGYCLDTVPEKQNIGAQRRPTKFGCAAIMEVLRTLDVETWEKLPGTPVRVRREEPYGRIVSIGHFIKEQWLNMEELAKKWPNETTDYRGM